LVGPAQAPCKPSIATEAGMRVWLAYTLSSKDDGSGRPDSGGSFMLADMSRVPPVYEKRLGRVVFQELQRQERGGGMTLKLERRGTERDLLSGEYVGHPTKLALICIRT
jgi:hypothetical protein